MLPVGKESIAPFGQPVVQHGERRRSERKNIAVLSGLIIRSEGDGPGIHHEISVHKGQVVVVDVEARSSTHAGDAEFIGVGADAFRCARSHINRKHALKIYGIDGFSVGQGSIAAVGETVVEHCEGGLAGIGTQIKNIAIELLLLGSGDSDVSGIHQEIAGHVGKGVVVGIKSAASALSRDLNFIGIGNRISIRRRR